MKRKRLAAVVLFFSLGITNVSVMPVFATGIPTVSVAELTQLIINAQQQASQALDQLQAAKDAIMQAKNQYDNYKGMITGNNKLGDFLNDPTLNSLLPVSDWQNLYNRSQDLGTLRTRYGLTSSNSMVQAAFDKLLAQAGVLEDQYNASQKRIQNAQQLRQQLNNTNTPADREQLQLRYEQERLELENQKAALDNSRYLMQQKDKIEDKRRQQAFEDYMLGKSPSRPKYE
ncbi:type IV secretion system protein [Pantoea ananatis]|uniref:type IV secretion system protein n=2 Tax=Pantoea ananas TaxID=553 RepID=UPI00221ED691|nr:type IV secretion system protein [Pantoea ananatis]MCW0309911.1 Type IV secretion system protein virB5 [Pantoea ananatis]MCW0341607.1 Type IV secretion system protein virB5 [Pantoea ananatis]MCW0360107.1 Type IV secretion system protein virB5 [Pantoea ananatis]MCW0364770.1 Type IV secretion system protein virB5 [Pantoea ananatis]MCW1777355.1 type IV secretion system protein [Pantoea ananatis]